MNRKATIRVSVRLVIIVILALVILILLVALFKNLFGESTIKIDEELSRYALPPTAIISRPSPAGIYTVFQPLTFDGSKSYDRYYRIVGYFWDFDSDRIIDSNEATYNHSYWEPGEYNVTLKVVNEPGAIGTASQIIRVVTNNRKDENIKNSLFLIRDNDRTNEETILRLIPVTTWYDADGLHSIPYYVYYVSDSDNTLTQSQLKERMDKYEKKHAYIFDDNKMSDDYCLGSDHCVHSWGGYTINIYREGNLDGIYFDFWELYEYVVLVDPDETDSKLIASLFAAFYNSPIIFVDDGNLNKYKSPINNSFNTRRVYCIEEEKPTECESLDKSVMDFITDNNLDYKPYSPQVLRTGTVNRIIRLTSNVTMHHS